MSFALNSKNSLLCCINELANLAPIFTLLTAVANLVLAIIIYRYTRAKNKNDIKIKWFQELVYTPNKEALSKYFKRLHELKSDIKTSPDGNLIEEDKIKLMNIVKQERQEIVMSFIEGIKLISTPLYKSLLQTVDELTDKLTEVFDNDELKFNNEKTYSREVTNKISNYKINS